MTIDGEDMVDGDEDMASGHGVSDPRGSLRGATRNKPTAELEGGDGSRLTLRLPRRLVEDEPGRDCDGGCWMMIGSGLAMHSEGRDSLGMASSRLLRLSRARQLPPPATESAGFPFGLPMLPFRLLSPMLPGGSSRATPLREALPTAAGPMVGSP